MANVRQLATILYAVEAPPQASHQCLARLRPARRYASTFVGRDVRVTLYAGLTGGSLMTRMDARSHARAWPASGVGADPSRSGLAVS